MDDVARYDAQADTISLGHSSADANNQIVLRRLKRNNEIEAIEMLRIVFDNDDDEDEEEEDFIYYFPGGAYDMGWLGYFVGKNDHLEQLVISPFIATSPGSSIRDFIEPFFRGVSRNKSIHCIKFDSMDMLGGEVFTMLDSFFKDNHNLTTITIKESDFGDEGCRLFALAIGSCTHKSLQEVELENNNISEGGMVKIIRALSMHHKLKRLDLDGNCLRKNGCEALAALLQRSATELQYLFISRNDIGDEGIEVLVPALSTSASLQTLNVNNNPSITSQGWQRFATILEMSKLQPGGTPCFTQQC